jgi:hypothetical protein
MEVLRGDVELEEALQRERALDRGHVLPHR